MTTEQLFLALLLITIGLLLFAEIFRQTDASRIAALLAILTILGADYFFIKAMPFGSGWEFERPAAAQRHAGRGHGATGGNGAGGAAGAAERGSDSASASASAASGSERGAGADEGDAVAAGPGFFDTLNGASRSAGEWVKSWFKSPNPQSTGLASVHMFKDCEACPQMVRIPAGARLIGARAGDPLADAGETSQREVRFWPGFAVARVEVTNAQLKAAGVEPADKTCSLPGEGHPEAPAACLSAREMQDYADWLTRLTGRQYRLLNAAEWEFAALSSAATDLGAERMGGGLAEMVSDCWPTGAAGTQMVADDLTRSEISRCSHRVVKDGADGEPKRWQRPSARRAFDAAARSPRIGFRVMRTFDLTAKNGF